MARSKTPGVRQLPSGAWRAEIMLGGHRHSDTFPTQERAVAWRAALADRHSRGAKLARRGAMRLADFWPEFIATRQDAATADQNLKYWRARIEPEFGRTPMRRITGRMLDEWVDELLDEGLSANYVGSVLYTVSAMFRVAHAREYVEVNPVKMMERRPTQNRTETRVITDAEFERMLAVADAAPRRAVMPTEHTRALLVLMRDTGARISEAAGLAVEHVMIDRLRFAQRVERATRTIKPGLKNHDEERYGVLTRRTRDYLAPIMAGKARGDLLFSTEDGRPLDLGHWTKHVWHPIVEAAGLLDDEAAVRPTPHDLRHTFASLTARRPGVTVVELRDALGQRDSRVLERYLHTDADLVVRLAAEADAEAEARVARNTGRPRAKRRLAAV
jgi:integrase